MNDFGLIILSGGKNSRMGKNKAFLTVDKRPIILRIIEQLGPLFKGITVVTNDPESYRQLLGVKVVTDILTQKGPLSGIHAGLVHSDFAANLVVACDMPFVNSGLASFLIDASKGYDVTVPILDGKYQPLFAVYSKECIAPIEEQLNSGHYKITAFYPKVKLKDVDEPEWGQAVPVGKTFYNVNTPAELEEARLMVESDTAKGYVNAWRWKDGQQSEIEDSLAMETPLTIFLNDQEIVTLLSTPAYLEELAVGFLFSEGLVKEGASDVKVSVDQEKGLAWVKSSRSSAIAEQAFLKRYITTGCGKGTTFYNVLDAKSNRVETELTFSAQKISNLMVSVQQASQLFKETGGVHLTALCTQEEVVIAREDIGRHNALDKIVGRCFMEGISLKDKIIFSTGRLSSEILLKVARLGVPVLVSRSAPTELAVRLSKELGVTLIGFARAGRMNIYSNESRIEGMKSK